MKMIELKHIAPYLPYGLNIWYNATKGVILDKMDTSNIRDVILYNKNYKPILRPLSDLTKEIEHDGQKFVPSEALNTDFTGATAEALKFAQFNVIEKLLEWNFDIHGLIESGLAIDINTLKLDK